jgi:FlaA1/EpsC-like NDP-sugar epimerase
MTINNFTTQLLSLLPVQRRLLLIAADVLILPLAVWLSFWLRLADPLSNNFVDGLWLLPAAWLIGLPLFALSGQYKGLTRYVGSRALYQLAIRNGWLVLLLLACGVLLRLPLPPRSSWILLWILITALSGALRFSLRDLLNVLQSKSQQQQTRVAIYGAGAAGVQLATALGVAASHSVALFVDDDPRLWSREINGVPIKPPQVLRKRKGEFDQVLLAIPSLTRSRRRQIVAAIQSSGIPLQMVPSIEEITSGRASIAALRPLAIEELLGRDPLDANSLIFSSGVRGSCVWVSGAGGSIGSELCRQILQLQPRRLVLLERSEPSLYAILQELNSLLPVGVDLVPVLGSAADAALVQSCFRSNSVDVAFHAAAYKHVPLVEANPIAGLANNVLSTKVVCSAARRCGLQQVVLISTDKAVRPTNVMGASKRLAELVLLAQPRGITSFSMVRFGNVLGSSGSVVPLFRKQIAAGGPITLTHPEIVRYFMTIPEAAQLVLQASCLAEGGDVFLLDMGEPIRIKHMAEQMVRLSGLSLRDLTNPNGDIEIVYTGLRPGEKLYEELLIDGKSKPTAHPLIFKGLDQGLPPEQLWPQLDLMQAAIERQDVEAALAQLQQLVPEWQRSDALVVRN